MSAKTNLLILYVVLCQGIIGTLSEENIDESSDLLVRQKRVINRMPGGDEKELIKNAPYIVSVKPFRARFHCAGAILTKHVAVTAAKCVQSNVPDLFRVHSGTARAVLSGSYATHNITNRIIKIGDHHLRPNDGIALITVSPPFTYSITTGNIELYQGHLHPGLHGTVSGWGCSPTGDIGTAYPDFLRSITVPVMTHQDCANIYKHNFPISENDVCTLDPSGYRHCGVHDDGAPLVIDVGYKNELLGIHISNELGQRQRYPDVFVNLVSPTYKTWIEANIRSLEASLFMNS